MDSQNKLCHVTSIQPILLVVVHVYVCLLILCIILPYLNQEGQEVESWSCPLFSILPMKLFHLNHNRSPASFLAGSKNGMKMWRFENNYGTIIINNNVQDKVSVKTRKHLPVLILLFPIQYIQQLSSFDRRLNPFPETQTQKFGQFAYYLKFTSQGRKKKTKNALCLHFWHSDIPKYSKQFSFDFLFILFATFYIVNIISAIGIIYSSKYFILNLEQDLAFFSLFKGSNSNKGH